MMLILTLLVLVLIIAALFPVLKVMLGFYGFDQALGAWAVLFILAWVL
jgi:hypothetical protein